MAKENESSKDTSTTDPGTVKSQAEAYAEKLSATQRKELLNKLKNRVILTGKNGDTAINYIGNLIKEDENYYYIQAFPEPPTEKLAVLKKNFKLSKADGNAYKIWSIYPAFWKQVLDFTDLSAGDKVKIVSYIGYSIKVVEGTVKNVDTDSSSGTLEIEGGDYTESVHTKLSKVSTYIYRMRNERALDPVEKLTKITSTSEWLLDENGKIYKEE